MRSKRYHIILSVFLLLKFDFAFSESHISKNSLEIQIDGLLKEEAWKNSHKIKGFYNHFPLDNGQSENQTEAMIFHDGVNLYIGAIYHDTRPDHQVNTLKRDLYYEGVLISDCFGVVLDPYNTKDNGYLFALNAQGVQYDALIGNINELNSSWNAIWKSSVSVKGNDKYFEIAIPLDAINFNADNQSWGVQLFMNDTKINLVTTSVQSPRNFVQYDLRYTEEIEIKDLPDKVSNKYSIQPEFTATTNEDFLTNERNQSSKISLNGQYNITPSLRLDLAVNPDFSQVEVDQQVTNLSRFAINFPERRKFFLENSDLFSGLGTFNTNPFYSRRIGANSDIIYGAKISGNLSSNNRIGLLNAQTRGTSEVGNTNYTVAVTRHRFSDAVNSTAYLVNTLEDQFYNRIGGAELDYKSENGKWISNVNFSKSFTSHLSGKNNFIGASVGYNTKAFEWELEFQNTGRNYRAETGFIPFQFNYDASSDSFIQEGFTISRAGFQVRHFPKKSKKVDWIRRFWLTNMNVYNEDNSLRSATFFWSPFAIRFKNSSYVYAASQTQIENLRYSFDFLQSGDAISPGQYVQTFARIGYWAPNNQKFYYNIRFEYGQFYGGWRLNPEVRISYRVLPIAVISAGYEINDIDLGAKGSKTFHQARLSSEIYFDNRLNWTTYFQYNTQANNVNINSRVQWEYKPLSYIYLVFTNNYNEHFDAKNWGLSFKINRRLDF